MTCSWHNCPDQAVYQFIGFDGQVRGLCQLHSRSVREIAQSIGLYFKLVRVITQEPPNAADGQ